MASIQKEVRIGVSPAQAWSALRDIGALHTRLVVGFVTDCRLEGEARVVTFANGMVARELIVDVSDEQRRVAWAVVGGQLTHHNASAQVVDDGDNATHCRVVWVADMLPHAGAPAMAGMIELGLAAMKKTLESASSTAPASPGSR